MGDTQPLPNGNVFVGWGSEPYFSEYSRSGKLLLEGELPGPDLTYRATVGQWVGLPLSPPVGAARGHGWRDHRLRQLERRHPGRLLEGAGGNREHPARSRRDARTVGIRDGDSGGLELRELPGPGACRERRRDRPLAAVRRLAQPPGRRHAACAPAIL